MSGKIWIHRQMRNWEWYRDTPVKCLFLHLLLEAAYKDGRSYGISVRRGQVATGRKKLAEQTGLTEQQIRTALAKLAKTGEITTEISARVSTKESTKESTNRLPDQATNRFTLITILNYDKYQAQKDTSNQPKIGGATREATKEATTIEEVKKKRIKEKDIAQTSGDVGEPIIEIPLNRTGEVHLVTQEDLDLLIETYPNVDVMSELRKIRLWNINNPKRRKTKNGIRNHIATWLDKEQNRSRQGIRPMNVREAQTVMNEEIARRLNEQAEQEAGGSSGPLLEHKV